MAPILNHIASMAESLVSRQYEMEHTHSPPPKDYTPFVVAIVMLALAWSTIVLRLYTRIRLISAIGWDDATMIIALVGTRTTFQLIKS